MSTLLLSFLLPFHMVIPKRISVNTSFSFDINTISNSQKSSIGMAIDIEVDTLRDWSISSSTNSSRIT